MTKRLCSIGFVLLLLFAGVALAAHAQGELTETYVSNDGAFSFQYPEGWFVQEDEDGMILLSDDEAAFGDQGPGEGSALFMLVTPAYLESVDVVGDTPAAVLTSFASNAEFEIGSRKGFRLGERAAVRSDITGPDMPGMIIAVKFGDSASGLMVVTTPRDPADFEDLVLEIAGTFAPTGGVPCTVSADKEQTIQLRVGPGANRTVFAFLPANQAFVVLGEGEAADGTLWWKLDKEEVAPQKAVNEAWVAQADVVSSGDCGGVQEAAAPPIIPIVQQPPTGAGGQPTGPQRAGGRGRGIYVEFPEWQSQLPAEIRADSAQTAKLVVYVTPILSNVQRETYYEFRDGQPTGATITVERNRVDYIVRVIDTATGAEIANQTFVGGEPPPFPPSISVSGVLNGPPPRFEDVLPWLQGLLG